MDTKTLLTASGAALTALIVGCTTTASVTTASTPREAAGLAPLSTEKKREIDEGYRGTLQRLYETTPGSRELVGKAAGVLVFPRAISAGLGVGGEFGTGELRMNNRIEGYYRTTSASIGWQAGAQSRALVFLFMTPEALNRFRDSKGWSVGADASVALLKIGANGEIDANFARAPTIAFVMTNAGLMANLSLEGTKVTRIG
ncbi:BPSL1445 family SYLF domain-containing lipoprotein [Aquabacterium sp.]|uniref:BPSL1445 family SYLF domain-containing lipoprotein n=1 Tax=Aquabacterium sp. TaxID=1872578 RepID=UPI002B89C144|nr:YSC84-related protein [Aquabacterium sp.]HSW03082.1 YSC84-related protein [Aquabacterium sp.]